MTSLLTWTPPLALYATVAAAVMLLGFAVLLVNPRSLSNRLFAAFAILEGGTSIVVIGSLVAIPDSPELALLFSRVFWIYNAPLKSILLYFALAFPTPSPMLRRFPRALPALVLLPGVGGALLFLFDPSLYLAAAVNGAYFFGPLARVDIVLQALFVALAFVILAGKFKRGHGTLARRETALVLAALLLLFVPVAVLNGLTRTGLPGNLGALLSFNASLTALAMFWGGFFIVAGAASAVARTRTASSLEVPEAKVVGYAFVLCLVVGTAFAFSQRPSYWMMLVALSIGAGVVLLAYGIVKYQLFGLDVGFRRGAPVFASLLAVLAIFAGLAFLIQPFDGGHELFGVEASFLAAGLLTASLSPAVVTATRSLTRRAVGDPGSLGPYANLKRLEVYRAALEKARASPETMPEAWLDELRLKLGLDRRDHEIVTALVESGAPVTRGSPLTDGSMVLGKYKIIRRLGEGGWGAAYLAHHVPLDRPVVLKEVREILVGDRAALVSLVREARLAALMQHPNVVTVHDLEEHLGGVIIVMEYCEGGSLEERLSKGPLTPLQVLRLLDDVLRGIEALSLAGVVHRDLKPSNVLFDRTERAKLGDLGVAYRPAGTEDRLTGTGLTHPIGTLSYASPEVVRGGEATTRSDLYSAAALAYRALAGESYVPARGVSAFDLQRHIVETEPDLARLPISNAFRGVLRRAFAKNPSERFPTAGAMRAALRVLPEARLAWQNEQLNDSHVHSLDRGYREAEP